MVKFDYRNTSKHLLLHAFMMWQELSVKVLD